VAIILPVNDTVRPGVAFRPDSACGSARRTTAGGRDEYLRSTASCRLSAIITRAVEERTSLDITTIHRKMEAGSFPQPLRVGRRRVAWRESDIAAWQAVLDV
jgi:prophage regulatory protein